MDAAGHVEEVRTFNADDVLFRRNFNFKPLAKHRTMQSLDWMVKMPTPPKTPVVESNGCVVVVDTFSTGAVVAKFVQDKGYHCVRLFSQEMGDLMDLLPEVRPSRTPYISLPV